MAKWKVWMQALSELGVEIAPLSRSERKTLGERWNRAFAPGVRQRYGVDIYRGYRWHAYSYKVEPCLEGSAALAEYLSKALAPFYLFDEPMEICGLCRASSWPDLSVLRDDAYVVPERFEWSMAFPHEQPHLGPYLASNHKAITSH